MSSGNGYVYSLMGSILGRSKIPLDLNASGSAGGVNYSAQLSLFGGYQQVDSAMPNDVDIPGIPSGCPPPSDQKVNTSSPGIRTHPFPLYDVVYDSYGG